jgi:hypothetical protein
MSRPQIAPRLQALRYIVEGERHGANLHAVECRRELRALLAVARAAERWAQGDARNDGYGIPRALARLRRASGRKP